MHVMWLQKPPYWYYWYTSKGIPDMYNIYKYALFGGDVPLLGYSPSFSLYVLYFYTIVMTYVYLICTWTLRARPDSKVSL